MEVVRLLIKQGADVKAQFVSYVIDFPHIKRLLTNVLKGGQTLFYSAITKSAWDLAQVLIENTPDVNSLGQVSLLKEKYTE